MLMCQGWWGPRVGKQECRAWAGSVPLPPYTSTPPHPPHTHTTTHMYPHPLTHPSYPPSTHATTLPHTLILPTDPTPIHTPHMLPHSTHTHQHPHIYPSLTSHSHTHSTPHKPTPTHPYPPPPYPQYTNVKLHFKLLYNNLYSHYAKACKSGQNYFF